MTQQLTTIRSIIIITKLKRRGRIYDPIGSYVGNIGEAKNWTFIKIFVVVGLRNG